jgi:superfamily II DNA or RNA helicase
MKTQYYSKSKTSTKIQEIVLPTTCITYMGQKGYTISKNELTEEQLIFLKSKLIAKPMVMGSIVIGPPKTFPIFRESTKKIYVPRYFGEKHFGPASSVSLPDGYPIDVPFVGMLRPPQIPVVEAFLKHCGQSKHAGGLIELPCAGGKTICAVNIISNLKIKTLIIVNKEFLLNQWIERIKEFLPTARIGRIQGPVIDIEDKDIVIGMLQSLSMKDYPSSTFETFGLTIFDEVHHISSEVFSNSLFKIVTRYMLGLSATMERKDGTTDIFKMFLGEIVYKGTNAEHHDVLVRAIEYKTNDVEFNDTEIDYRGNPQYSKMIVKLCSFVPRSEFIVKVVCDLIKENPENQIMILGHNRSVLYFLHDAIKEKNIASIGYYLGSMKQEKLDESAKKQIICGSFSMVAEGLDISTLSTMIFVTPKTDIVQSVGRILRTKHKSPIIIDIVDNHQLFQNQWKKRRVYYKKCNYRISMTDSNKYSNNGEPFQIDNGIWKKVFEPNSKNNEEIMVGKCLINLDDLE